MSYHGGVIAPPWSYTRRQINQDRMIFGVFSVNSEPIFLKFSKAIFYSNPNSGSKNFAKLYLIFQKLDHLTCNKIIELVCLTFEIRYIILRNFQGY